MRRAALCTVIALTAPWSVSPAAGQSRDDDFAPPTRRDAQETPAGPLDIRAVTFGQRDTRMALRLRTHGTWNAGQIAADGLCLALRRTRVVGRICVGAERGAAVLRYRRVARNGIVGRARTIPALVSRDDERSLSATFRPRAARLPRGRLRWAVESRWQDAAACAAICADRAPDAGWHLARVSVLAQPRCFGAAARAARRPCRNPALRTTVVPNPSNAVLTPDSPCRRAGGTRARSAVLRPCEFGDLDTRRAPDAALIGDSHAAHWRAAVDVVAEARGWRAVSLTRPGCAFSTEVYAAPPAVPANCRRHSSEALRWLRTRPSVHTVVTSASAGRGLGAAGFTQLWAQLPRTVRRIYVLRDVPRARLSTPDCVRARMRRNQSAARVCAMPRSAAILADPAAEAARGAGSRVRLVDLTHHFCDASRCFPVVGGAYVYKDANHMNSVFATSLGPFLLRRMR